MTDLASDTRTIDDGSLRELEHYRGELTGYCYRMLGSAFDADDAVQETMVRAWRSFDSFEGRSSLRGWVYRIATNVCLDALRSRQRRALPVDLSPAVSAQTAPGAPLPEQTWITPIPDNDVAPREGDPAERAVYQDTIRLAFVAALQHLPPRQRAVLILREVLCWQATEVAELLDTTVASVNSALQRARATLAASNLSDTESEPVGEDDKDLLARYCAAFEAYDIDRLVTLLHEDARQSMPPLALWLEGRDEVRHWLLGHGIGCRGSKMLPMVANGMPAFAQYRCDPHGGYEPWALQVIEISAGKIVHVHSFLDTPMFLDEPRLFARFGLPAHLDADGTPTAAA